MTKNAQPRTWGDIAKEAVRERGALFPSEALGGLRNRLGSVAYPAVAAACAERLLHRHLQLPVDEQQVFTRCCREPLDWIWGALDSAPEANRWRKAVKLWLERFDPLNPDNGHDHPNDADHDPAAAVIFAAESLVRQSPESAWYAMGRVIDDGFCRARMEREGIMQIEDYIAECCHAIVQGEVRWVGEVFRYVQAHSLSYETINELRHLAII